jgi:hypothetical protein
MRNNELDLSPKEIIFAITITMAIIFIQVLLTLDRNRLIPIVTVFTLGWLTTLFTVESKRDKKLSHKLNTAITASFLVASSSI